MPSTNGSVSSAASHMQQEIPAFRVGHPLGHVRQYPPRAFHPVDTVQRQPRRPDLFGQLFGMVKEGGCEVVEAFGRISVLAVAQILLEDSDEPDITQQLPRQPVQGRGPAGDGGGEQPPAGLEDSGRLLERA